ncbi:hypothetical protein BABINDRAFT_163258 [Babjeviella inositovora NRRL Y-12698]|uniref:Uncharacterized protein n=1 Tax=Babjeviella inositovora NRRL Y-12698 TaxID=984486 RepID=A0A1E3QJL4_9ASCO|nr:uncharacterized protein BABINDRAFT_163258 [Babjeviella inositovora NRRL Y-12698]ODQ77883.1 hypothetical protein BABINDRAFT_163258 [Babjeviella inositovora NRRL Y-12698]
MLVDDDMPNFGSSASYVHIPTNNHLPQQVCPSLWLGSLNGNQPDDNVRHSYGDNDFLGFNNVKIIISCQAAPDAIKNIASILSGQNKNAEQMMCFIVDPHFSPDKLMPEESLDVLNFISEYQPKLNQLYVNSIPSHLSHAPRLTSPIVAAHTTSEALFKVVKLIEYIGSKFPSYSVLVLTDKNYPGKSPLGSLLSSLNSSSSSVSLPTFPSPTSSQSFTQDQLDNELSIATVMAYLCYKFNLNINGAFDHIYSSRLVSTSYMAHSFSSPYGSQGFMTFFKSPEIKNGIYKFYEENLAIKMFGNNQRKTEGHLKRSGGSASDENKRSKRERE